MDAFLGEKREEKKGVNKIMIGAAIVALLVVAAGVWLLTRMPTSEDKRAEQTAGMFYEGSPELAAYTKDIVISTDTERTSEARLKALGTIQMAIHGTIRNKGSRVINGLEINVGVVDMANKVIKEKKTMVVPIQSPTLGSNETMTVFIPIDGFKPEDDRANVRWKVTGVRFQ